MENPIDAEKRAITAKKEENFSEWYTQVVINSEFVDYSAVSGCIVFRPSSYFAWNEIRKNVGDKFQKVGIKDAYFPMLIPERFLDKEKEHVEGFSPEVAWVTQTGNSTLSERLAIRPTSETIMYDSFAKWIRSWRDLPLRLNQWNTVIRWEFKHPTPLLRSREFMWNEGHTVFATENEANAERDVILGIYADVIKNYLAIPGIPGRKTDYEKFAGAVASYSIEHMVPDGHAIQGPDFHNDGQNFAKAFEISYIDKNNQRVYAYQNTFAISTRELGVVVMTHSDNKGLVLPPRIALIQIVIIPIYKDENKEAVMAYAKKVEEALSGRFRVYMDDRDDYSVGWKFNEWELKGVPLRIEIGQKEASSNQVTATVRHTGKKYIIKQENLPDKCAEILDVMHNELYEAAAHFMETHIKEVEDYEGLKNAIANGNFAQAKWCGKTECEIKIKEETGAKSTNMPFDKQGSISGNCVYCGSKAKYVVNFAKSY